MMFQSSAFVGDVVTAVSTAAAAAASATQTGVQVAAQERSFERENPCIVDYENKAKKYQKLQWATPIFTQKRVEYEKLANKWFKKAADARRTGCRGKKKKAKSGGKAARSSGAPGASFQPSVAPAAPSEGMAMGTKIAIAAGLLLLIGGAAYYSREKKHG